MAFPSNTFRSLLNLALSSTFLVGTYSHAEEVSFYGQRGVVLKSETTEPKIEFQRRAIAPPITPIEVIVLDDIEHKATSESLPQASSDAQKDKQEARDLTRNELLLAKKAQFYIEQSRQANTGLWDSVRGYPHTTMWDVASGIGATLALEGIGLKSSEVTLHELTQTLESLKKLPLYKNQLPNREYSTKTGLPSGRLSQTPSNGNGWSALDIGRLLIWLDILKVKHPTLEEDVDAIINSWALERAVKDNTLYGTKLYKGREYYRQEGRHGYLQYAIKGYQLFGYNIDNSAAEPFLDPVLINDIEVIKDNRNVPFFTSDPYVLGAIEFGIDPEWNQLQDIYDLHKNFWLENQILVSYGEDAMNKNPWFAYNNIYYYKKPWTSVSPSGKTIENPQQLSHKVAYGFSVLFDDEFSDALAEEVTTNSLQFRSISTGVYEDGGNNTAFNINTNSLILVALWYRSLGDQPIL